MNRHLPSCSTATEYVYRRQNRITGKETLAQELRRKNILNVPTDLITDYVVFDSECGMKTIQHRLGASTEIEHQHWLASLGLYGGPDSLNTEGEYFQKESDEGSDELIIRFYETLEKYSDDFYEKNKEKYKDIYENLTNRIEWAKGRVRFLQKIPQIDEQSLEHAKAIVKDSIKLRQKFDDWCRQLLVVGFNSNFYDLNLIAGTLLRHFNDIQPFKAPGGLHSRVKTDESDTHTNRQYGYDKTYEQDVFVSVLKRDTHRWLALTTTKLKFVDIKEFLPPNTSLSKFMKCYLDGEEGKAWFPYSLLTSPDDFDRQGFPKYEDFYSSLKNQNTLDDGTKDENVGRANHAKLKAIWDEQGMTTLSDLLKYYQMQDCIPFYKAVHKMRSMYLDLGCGDCFDYLTASSLSYNYVISKSNGYLYTTPEYLQDWHQVLLQNVVGGYTSLLDQAYAEAGVTPVRENVFGTSAEISRIIQVWDYNSLYPWVLIGDLPCAVPIARHFPEFKPITYDTRLENSALGILFARWLAFSRGTTVIHAGNGKEIKILGKFSVDAYEEETGNTWDLHGCYYHMHENCPLYRHEMSEESVKKHAKDKAKAEFIRTSGHTYTVVWECQFRHLMQTDPKLKKFLTMKRENEESNRPIDAAIRTISCFDDDECIDKDLILSKVKDGSFFGYLIVDVHVKPQYRKKLTNYPMIIGRKVIERDQLRGGQRELAETYNLLQKPQEILTGMNSAKKFLVISPMAEFWLTWKDPDTGECVMEITHVHQIIEYYRYAPLREPIQDLVQMRKDGDESSDLKVKADTAKILMNSCYGRTLMRRDLHTKCHLTEGKYVTQLASDPYFQSQTPILTTDEILYNLDMDEPFLLSTTDAANDDEDLFLVRMRHKKILCTEPTHVGVWVLQASKLRNMIAVRTMETYLNPRKFTLCYADTDSLFMCLTELHIDDCVKPEYKDKWLRDVRPQLFVNEYCDKHKENFIQTKLKNDKWNMTEECCKKENKRQSREPGLLKLEAEGHKFNALVPKSYILVNDNDGSVKQTHKGVQKRAADLLTWETYREARETGTVTKTANKGFRIVPYLGMCTYTQTKKALRSGDIKRRQDDDFPIHTRDYSDDED